MKRFYLSILLPTVLAAVTRRILSYVTAFAAQQPAVKAVCDLIESKLSELERTLSKDTISHYTERLLAQDRIRDNAFVMFRNYIEVFLKDKDQNLVNTAKQIMRIIRKYGYTLQRSSYEEQTDALNRMIAELNETQNHAAIALLNGVAFLDSLETEATAFEDLHKERIDVESEINYPRIRAAFDELRWTLRPMIMFLDTLNEAAFAPELPEIITNIEMELSDAMAKARTLKTLKEKEEDEDNEGLQDPETPDE